MATTRGFRWMQVAAAVFVVFGAGVSVFMVSQVAIEGPSFETLFFAGSWVLMTVAWIANFFYLRRPVPEGVVPESADADRPSFT